MNAVPAGTHFNFRQLRGIPHAEVWRSLDHTVARWVMSHRGSALLAEVAGWSSYAEGQGDSALPLQTDGGGRHGMRRLADDEVAGLAEPMVTAIDGIAPTDITTPFVMEFGYFYLRRNYLHECAVAAHIRQRRAAGSIPTMPMSEADLDALFDNQRGDDVVPQRDAVRRVLGRRLFVLTGGPGTGKTTTVLRMLLALGREHVARNNNGPPVIRISAPTGKAAQRLTDSLRQGSARLREGQHTLSDAWLGHLEAALGAESGTLHRLLGSRGHHGGFTYHAGNRIPADIVVVDEASMVDLAMLRALLEALHDEAVLVLVGDADQLTSVGTGSVLLDVVTAIEKEKGGDLVRLQHSFRADTALVPINEALRKGNAVAFDNAWQAAERRVVRHAVANRRQLERQLEPWCDDLRGLLGAAGAFDPIAGNDRDAIRRALDALRQQQLLCALRESDFGAEQVNDTIEARLREGMDGYENATWYPGRAVMIARNDYAFDLLNGDVGICLRDDLGHLQVWFEGAPGKDLAASATDAHPPLRSFAPGTLPAHQGAFAATVHKSQGSEYERVAVLLPPDPDNAVLSRQLLYTALTRARSKAELWATEAVLQATIASSIERSAALGQRLVAR